MKTLATCLFISSVLNLGNFNPLCEARHLHQSQDAQSFYQSFSQKAKETGPLQLMPLPDALQNLQTAVSEGQVTSFLQTNSPNQAAQDDAVPTLQSADAKVAVKASKTLEMPKVQPDDLLKAADEVTDKLLDGPAKNVNLQRSLPLSNPDKAPQPAESMAVENNLKDLIEHQLPLPEQVRPETLLQEARTSMPDPTQPLLELKSTKPELPSEIKDLIRKTQSQFQSFAAHARTSKDSGPLSLLPIRPEGIEAAFDEGSKRMMLPTQGASGNGLPLSRRLPNGGHSFAEIPNQRSASSSSGLAPAPSFLRGLAANAQRLFDPVASLLPSTSPAAQRSAVNVAATQANPLTNAFVVNHAVTQTGQLLQDYADHLPDLMPLPFQAFSP